MNSISKADIDKNFGKILKNYRLQSGLTQEQLSEKLGISLKYISRIETGKSGVKTQTLIKYMDILGICPNTLYIDLISNKQIKDRIILSEKINNLSSEKKEFISSIINLVDNL